MGTNTGKTKASPGPRTTNEEADQLEIFCEWLERPQAPSVKVVRLVVDDDFWDMATPSAKIQAEFIRQVSEFVERATPGVQLICAPGGAVVSRMNNHPGINVDGLNTAVNQLDAHLAALSSNKRKADWILGVDAVVREQAIVQTVMRLSNVPNPPVAIKSYPAPGEEKFLLAWKLACAGQMRLGDRSPWGPLDAVALSCHELVSFSNRALSRLQPHTAKGRIARKLVQATNLPHGLTVTCVHWLGVTNSNTFPNALENLPPPPALLSCFAPRELLRDVAEKHPVEGASNGLVATLLVRWV